MKKWYALALLTLSQPLLSEQYLLRAELKEKTTAKLYKITSANNPFNANPKKAGIDAKKLNTVLSQDFHAITINIAKALITKYNSIPAEKKELYGHITMKNGDVSEYGDKDYLWKWTLVFYNVNPKKTSQEDSWLIMGGKNEEKRMPFCGSLDKWFQAIDNSSKQITIQQNTFRALILIKIKKKKGQANNN